MLNLGIDLGVVNVAAVRDLLVVELEGVAVDNFLRLVVEDLEEGGLAVDVCILFELSVGQEVLSVDAVVRRAAKRQRADVKRRLGGPDASTETRLLFINRRQANAGVLVLPKAAEDTLHVTTGHANNSEEARGEHRQQSLLSLDLHRVDFVLVRAVEPPRVFDTFRGASFVEAGHLAFQKQCHFSI